MKELVKFKEVKELEKVEKSKAAEIEAAFKPMVDMLYKMEAAFESVVKEAKKGVTVEVSQRAKEVRLVMAKARIEATKVKDTGKAEYLRAERAIQGVYNCFLYAVTDKEKVLKEIEKHAEIQEQKRRDDLQAQRVAALSPYVDDAEERTLWEMESEVWDIYLAAKKKEKEDKEKAEAEAIRQAAEKEKERREQVGKLEAEKKKIEAEARKAKEKAEAAEAALRQKEAAETVERQATEARERDRNHKKKINNEIVDFLVLYDIAEEQSKKIVVAVVKGKCKNLKIL